MELGGAERALLGLLYAIDTQKVDVDLMINQHTGPFMELIPKSINLLPELTSYSVIEKSFKEAIKKRQWGVVFGRIIAKVRYKYYLWKNSIQNDGTASHFVMDSVAPFLPSLKYLGHYDLAISFLDPPHIVQDKVDATKRVEWIHTDFSGKLFHYDNKLTYSRWAANDFIISISDDVTTRFLESFPEQKDKILKIENIIPADLVKKQAISGDCKEYDTFGVDCIKICSVGRISYAKNFECIPNVAKILKDKGLLFHWWVIGPGDTEGYNKMAASQDVSDYVSFIGPRDNPYPYMLHCDLYVQPSRYEGKAVTVQEAQMLARPVIITRYPTSGSQIQNGVDGVICELDNESIADIIFSLSKNKELRDNLGRMAAQLHAGNNEEVLKVEALLR